MGEVVYIQDVSLASADGKRIRKEILPRDKQFQWPNQPGRILHITSEVLQQVVKNFKEGVVDTVPFFKVNDKNAHVEDPELSRGKIVDLILTDKGLDAIIEPISPEVGKQILASSLGASAGIRFEYADHVSGENKGAVLRHVAWTPEPWIPGMKPFEEVSLSGECFEAVFLSSDTDGPQRRSDEGGDNDMDPKELQAMLSAEIAKALEPITTELENTKTALGEANTTIANLSTQLNERHNTATAESVKQELDALVEAGLPPAIADLASPILLEAANEVHLSSGETTTVAAQLREILGLIPKVDFSEKGDTIPDGAVVVLSAEQVKDLGYKVKEGGDDDDKANLSAEEKATAEGVAAVMQFVPADKKKEA